MNYDQAKQTINTAYFANAILNQQLLNLEEKIDSDEFINLRRGFGEVMGHILTEILNPLFNEYPDLKPKELGGTADRIPNADFEKVFDLIEGLSS